LPGLPNPKEKRNMLLKGRERKQLITDYNIVFNSEHGKNVFDDLKKRCPLLTQSINTTNGIDVNKLLYYEGQRSVFLYIFKMLNIDPYAERAGTAVNDPY
jgi:hypothetical protein